MKHHKLPVTSQFHARCKCGHAIQPGEPRVKLIGVYDKCNTCYLKSIVEAKGVGNAV